MKQRALFAALAATLALGSTTALADRGWGHRYYSYPLYPSPYYIAPYYPGPFYGPGVRFYGPPLPIYGPPPVRVERYYIEEAPPPPVHRQYSERSQAQIAPPEPRREAPRMERISLSARELFGFDQAKLRTPQPKLDEIAALMKRHREVESVRITGYTDRIGTDAYNMTLSKRRADAVKAYLVAHGVEASRLVAVGKGEADPVVQCDDKKMADLIQCLEPNRRVEVEQITVERRAR